MRVKVSTFSDHLIVRSIYSPHDDAIKHKHFPRYWPFVREIHRSPVDSPHKGHNAELWSDVRLNKQMSKQSRCWWFVTPSCPLWLHCNGWHKNPALLDLWGGGNPPVTTQFREVSMSWRHHKISVFSVAICFSLSMFSSPGRSISLPVFVMKGGPRTWADSACT